MATTDGSFEFATADRIVFGPGRAAGLPELVGELGTRALVCTGSRPDRHRALLERLRLPTATHAITGEPTIEDVRATTELARDHAADLIIGIGGGSVLDAGKAVAMLLGNGGEPEDYLEVVGRGRPITSPSVAYVAVPTTAGTGSEVTANAVLTSTDHAVKASVRSRFMLPRLAVVDPMLTIDCPPAVTASSGLDALTQCLEPFVSVQASPLTDALAREGLTRASTALRRAYADGSDVEARTDMSICSLTGGMCLANAKLGVVHGFAAPLGGMTGAPHGALCAALLPAAIETNVRALRERQPDGPGLAKYRVAARLLTGRLDAEIEDGIDWIRDTVQELGVPGLRALGLRPEDSDEAVEKAREASSTKGNPIPLTRDELRSILEASMGRG